MLAIVGPDASPRNAAQLTAVLETASAALPAKAPEAPQLEMPPACIALAADVDPSIAETVAENTTNSQDTAFETRLSKQPSNQAANQSAAAVPTTVPTPIAAPSAAAVPATNMDQTMTKNVAENETDSQDAAFETWLSEQSWNQGAPEPGATGMNELLRAAMAKARLEHNESSANANEYPEMADAGGHINRQPASA